MMLWWEISHDAVVGSIVLCLFTCFILLVFTLSLSTCTTLLLVLLLFVNIFLLQASFLL